MQVGALRALIEAGFKLDLLVGTSIGAVNAAGLALWGVDLTGIEALEHVYSQIASADLMDSRLGGLTLRALSGRPDHRARRRAVEFAVAEGLSPDLRFDQLRNVRLAMIGADLTSGQPVIYGQDPSQSVLEGLLASFAAQPWFNPIETEGRFIVDGGVLSNLPIEPALTMGATEIVALDLNDPADMPANGGYLGQYLGKLVSAVIQRHACLETALAEAQGVPVHNIGLRSTPPVPIWDFRSYRDLIQIGYEIACSAISGWIKPGQPEMGLPSLIAEKQPCWEFA
jgi:NTE family protein